MRRLLSVIAAATLVGLGCHSMGPQSLRPPLGGTEAAAPAQAALEVGVQWPRRQAQVIPESAEVIWLSLKKGNQTLRTVDMRRPDPSGTQTATMSLQVDAGTGLTVRAEAFREGQATSSTPIAVAERSGVSLVANQRTSVILDLAATSPSSVTSFTPTNGGPGVKVSVTGQFSSSGYYRLALGSAETTATYKSSKLLEAPVPLGGETGLLTIYDDGFPWASVQSFRVLSRLDLAPAGPQVVAGGQSLVFSVPTAQDTAGQVVETPTVTGWMLVNPVTFELSDVGTLSDNGGTATFTASPTAKGSAWIYARSGTLVATASVKVQ